MMARNPFLDPARSIMQGKSDEELLEELVSRGTEQEQPDAQGSIIVTGPLPPGTGPTSLNEDYVHIPAEAFRRILASPEYRWLGEGEGGLYVARKKLVADSGVRAAAQGVKDLSGLQDGQTLGDITWYEAKQLAKNLDGLMLTPAMFWCVAEFLEKKGKDGVLDGTFGTDGEWLDAIVELSTLASLSNSISAYTADASLYTHTLASGNTFDRQSGHRHLLDGDCRDTNARGYFRLKDVVNHTGFPKKVGKNSKAAFFQGAPTYGTYAAVWQHNMLTASHILTIDYRPDSAYASLGMRLCKTPGQHMLDYLNKHPIPSAPGGSPWP